MVATPVTSLSFLLFLFQKQKRITLFRTITGKSLPPTGKGTISKQTRSATARREENIKLAKPSNPPNPPNPTSHTQIASPDPTDDMVSPQSENNPQEGPSAGPTETRPAVPNPSLQQSRMSLPACLSLPAVQHQTQYSVTSYRKDAIVLRQIILGIGQGLYLPLGELIMDFDDLTCDVLYKTMCSDKS